MAPCSSGLRSAFRGSPVTNARNFSILASITLMYAANASQLCRNVAASSTRRTPAPDFIRVSPLADQAGWVDVDQNTLRHKKYDNIWSLGDVMNAPNAKTAAAARKQAPVVAENLLADLAGRDLPASYDGYGSCPLTVERGKIVLAEFLYGGKLAPTFPSWFIDGTRPSRMAWYLKERVLPPLYWEGMLKGREWLAKPEMVDGRVD